MITRFTDQEEDAPILTGLGFQEIDRRTHRIKNGCSAVARLEMFESVVEFVARMRVIVNQMRSGIEAHQSNLAPLICQEEIEEGAQFGDFAEFQGADAPKFDCNDKGDWRGIHLFLHSNVLGNAVILENEVGLLKAVKNSAISFRDQGRNEDFRGRNTKGFRRLRKRLRRFERGQLLSGAVECESSGQNRH